MIYCPNKSNKEKQFCKKNRQKGKSIALPNGQKSGKIRGFENSNFSLKLVISESQIPTELLPAGK